MARWVKALDSAKVRAQPEIFQRVLYLTFLCWLRYNNFYYYYKIDKFESEKCFGFFDFSKLLT